MTGGGGTADPVTGAYPMTTGTGGIEGEIVEYATGGGGTETPWEGCAIEGTIGGGAGGCANPAMVQIPTDAPIILSLAYFISSNVIVHGTIINSSLVFAEGQPSIWG
jgi:hypothetical protein